ncbi:MAG: response regulator [Acidobacteriota bacterium]|nr:response regulator [Acidobacteriota bacterium]
MPASDSILVVDDNRKNLYTFTRLLENLGHRAVCVGSGPEALQKLLVEEYALILLDIQMPVMDGFETARLIKAREKTRNIPIIFITAVLKEEEFINRGFKLGAVDYITKPVAPFLLKNKIQVFLRLRRQEKELADLNSTLEQRVKERTAELQDSNEILRREITEHRRTEEKLARLVEELESKNTALAKADEAVRELNRDLERRVEKRTAQLESAQRELVEKAHKAGMADIAASVLHNVGNILSSVITSGEVVRNNMVSSKLHSLTLANELLQQNLHRIEEFIMTDPKAGKLFNHYLSIEARLKKEQQKNLEDVERILSKVDLIRDVVMAQQDYATGGFQPEMLQLEDCVEDALKIQEGDIRIHGVEVEKDYHPAPKLLVQRSKIIHILVNMLKNAREAMQERKRIKIAIEEKKGFVYLKISDSGRGIRREHLKLIFNHGFTTKETGHGFGLHSCANAMNEMGGRMWAESEGEGRGSTFYLEFPRERIAV